MSNPLLDDVLNRRHPEVAFELTATVRCREVQTRGNILETDGVVVVRSEIALQLHKALRHLTSRPRGMVQSPSDVAQPVLDEISDNPSISGAGAGKFLEDGQKVRVRLKRVSTWNRHSRRKRQRADESGDESPFTMHPRMTPRGVRATIELPSTRRPDHQLHRFVAMPIRIAPRLNGVEKKHKKPIASPRRTINK